MTVFWALAILFVLGKAVLGGWGRAGVWAALMLAGQVAALELYRAGTGVGYHHYRLGERPSFGGLLATGIGLQALAVAWGLRGSLGSVLSWLRRVLPGWRLPVFCLVTLAVSAKLSRPPAASALEFAFAAFVVAVQLANGALVVRSLPAPVVARFERLLDRVLGEERVPGEPEPGGVDAFALGAALFAFAAAAALNLLAYERHPHVPDEVVYLIHAEYLAHGRLELAAPPVPAGFDLDLMLLDPADHPLRWFCPVPPGWPLALAVGALLGATWLVNPVLGALTVLLTYLLARELTDRRSARWITGLLAASPWFTFMNMSYMTHSWWLFCGVFAALSVARSRRTGSWLWTLLGGAAIGMVSLIRPLEGLIVALALGLWSLGLGGRRLRPAAIAALVVGTVAVGALVFPYNAHLTGDPTQFPINEYVDRTYGEGKNRMGFGEDVGLDFGGLDPWPGHSPFQALVNAHFNGFAIQAELFGWGTGSLFLALFLLLGGRLYRKDRAMLCFTAAIVLANSFYWFAGGPDFGARYWYPVIVPLVILSVSGLRALEARVTEPARVRALVYLLVSFAWLSWVPWRAVDKYFGYRGMHPVVRRLDREHHFGRSLVLVQGGRHPEFASAAAYNPLDWEADAPVYAWDRDAETRRELLLHYADRPVWVVSPEGRASGPWSAEELLEENP